MHPMNIVKTSMQGHTMFLKSITLFNAFISIPFFKNPTKTTNINIIW